MCWQAFIINSFFNLLKKQRLFLIFVLLSTSSVFSNDVIKLQFKNSKKDLTPLKSLKMFLRNDVSKKILKFHLRQVYKISGNKEIKFKRASEKIALGEDIVLYLQSRYIDNRKLAKFNKMQKKKKLSDVLNQYSQEKGNKIELIGGVANQDVELLINENGLSNKLSFSSFMNQLGVEYRYYLSRFYLSSRFVQSSNMSSSLSNYQVQDLYIHSNWKIEKDLPSSIGIGLFYRNTTYPLSEDSEISSSVRVGEQVDKGISFNYLTNPFTINSSAKVFLKSYLDYVVAADLETENQSISLSGTNLSQELTLSLFESLNLSIGASFVRLKNSETSDEISVSNFRFNLGYTLPL